MFQQQIKFSGLSKAQSASTRLAVRELRRLDAKRLFADSMQFVGEFDKMTIFKPTVEPKLPGAFLTENPQTIWKSGEFKQRPLMLSFVPVEGGIISGIFKSQSELNKANERIDQILEAALELKPENVIKVKERYLSGIEKVSMDDAKAVLQVRFNDLFLIYLRLLNWFFRDSCRWSGIVTFTIHSIGQCRNT